jgi:hypothetical protein
VPQEHERSIPENHQKENTNKLNVQNSNCPKTNKKIKVELGIMYWELNSFKHTTFPSPLYTPHKAQ